MNHFRNMLDFRGVERLAHDQGSCNGSVGVTCKHGPGIHKHRTIPENQDAHHSAFQVRMVEHRRTSLEMIIESVGNRRFTAAS